MLQLDYKVDNGSWHYQSEWDQDYGYNTNKSLISIEKGTYTNTAVFDKTQFESISSGETLPRDSSYFDSHTWQFRARFLVTYQDSGGTGYSYFSGWSQPVSFSNKQTAEDPARLIGHAPVLKSAAVVKDSGTPLLEITADKPHTDLEHLNAISNGWLKTEIWVKSGTGDWELIHKDNFVERFNGVNVLAYFGLRDSYDAAEYSVKMRYAFDYNNYPAAGKSGVIYSPFSNIISHGTPAWSNASQWAMEELKKADSLGLIPSSLKGADMTKPITREEFAELAVLLYEKAEGKASTPVSPNPFKDTSNPQILKAFNLGIVKGTSATTFAPKELTNREQVATMLSRAIRVMAPSSDFSTAGAPSFNDRKDISGWALEHVLYMAKMGIIKGTDGKFMPKAVTTAQTAAGYATTTREQAIAMSVRSFDNMDAIKASKAETSAGKTAASNANLVGKWQHIAASGNAGISISLELKSDGTFFKVIGTSTNYAVSGTSFEGKYKISGNKITFYNQAKGTGSGSSLTDMIFNSKIENVPVDDTEETFLLTDGSYTPVLTGLTGVSSVGAGNAHSIFLKSDGTVLASGGNREGQLGNGTTDNSDTPVQVSGLTDVAAVSAGGEYSLALTAYGTVWAWGNNMSLQLGIDSYATEDNQRSIPVQIPTPQVLWPSIAGANLAGAVTFTTTRFSDYAVGYNKMSFNDVPTGAWYNKAVSFIAARKITTGTGNGNLICYPQSGQLLFHCPLWG
jgi:hypothetical protein